MNTKAVNLMQNPATGQQNLDILPLLLGHAGSSLTGGMMGGLPGALLGLVAPGIASKALVNKLTNPLTRTKLIEKMIKNKMRQQYEIPISEEIISYRLPWPKHTCSACRHLP